MNSRRYAMASLSMVLLAVTIVSVSALGQNAYAGAGMSLSADCSGSTCDISGTTDRTNEPVMLVLSNSLGIHGVDQMDSSGGIYSTTVNVSNLDGTYTITVNQGSSSKYKISVDIDVSGGTSDSSVSVSNVVGVVEEQASVEETVIVTPLGGLSLTASGVLGSTTIDVSGTTDRSDEDVTIVVTASNGNKVHFAQESVSDGSFSTTWNVSASDDGAYTITANQGSSSKYNLSVSVDVSDGTSTSSASVSNQAAAAEEEAGSVEAVEVAAGGLTLTAGGVEGSTTIDVSGTTDRNGDIVLTVTAPNGNIVSIDQISPSGGSFMTTIEVGGQLWSQDGMYTVSAQQGDASNYKTSAQVEIVDGVVIPEFGVIAAMILAVAIVSIIVVTAKTKLSIVPRY